MTTRILMVDDEPDAEELFQQNFRREIRRGMYDFSFARSGDEALRVLGNEAAPDAVLVLSDINMPGMTGIQLLDRIKASWPQVIVFMITAYGDEATEMKVHNAGAAHFITKPVDFSMLKRELSEQLGGTHT